ncbi:MAG: HlyD family type I secretion periplasmic adaptor subunit [Kiloniellales bacterium]|nr:HlyD family type I secretion periplasmic adaptor subunit [Kiloniellales bacterium]
MKRLDQLRRRHLRSGWGAAAWPIMLLIAGLLAWSGFAELDEVAVAEGEVVPGDRVKIIQHLEGGVIEQILVADGQSVRAGDPLVQVQLPVTGLNEQELKIRLDGLTLTQARLYAEAEGGTLLLPELEADRHPDIAEAERRAFETRRQERVSRVTGLEEQVTQRTHAIGELKARKRALIADLGLGRERLEMSADLMKDGLISRLEHLDREREIKRLEGDLAGVNSAIPRAQAALAESEENLREEEHKGRREILELLRDVELEIARTRELLSDATVQAARQLISAPTNGTVKNLRYHTIGGVLRPGEPIMEIVPSDGALIIEARLNPADRGYVTVGQPARAKITTYDFIRYGALEGKIVQISPDSSVTSEGEAYFKVIMEPEAFHLGADPKELPIMPGMIASVDIMTGRKSVLSYIIEPVLKIKEEAFRERL